MTLLELLNKAPATDTAIVLPERGIRITYDSLRSQVAAAADTFASAGIMPGSRVAMALPNGLETIVCFLAASIAGTAAPLNLAYRHDEFAFYLEDTDAKLFVLPTQGADEARRAAAERDIPILAADLGPADSVRFSPAPGGRTAAPPGPDDVALILHTSGTTGRPKRVPLRHRNLAVSAENIANSYKLSSNDVALAVMPPFHVHGLLASTLTIVSARAAEHWPGWRGPTGMGHTDERDLPLVWGGKQQLNILWKSPLLDSDQVRLDQNQSAVGHSA